VILVCLLAFEVEGTSRRVFALRSGFSPCRVSRFLVPFCSWGLSRPTFFPRLNGRVHSVERSWSSRTPTRTPNAERRPRGGLLLRAQHARPPFSFPNFAGCVLLPARVVEQAPALRSLQTARSPLRTTALAPRRYLARCLRPPPSLLRPARSRRERLARSPNAPSSDEDVRTFGRTGALSPRARRTQDRRRRLTGVHAGLRPSRPSSLPRVPDATSKCAGASSIRSPAAPTKASSNELSAHHARKAAISTRPPPRGSPSPADPSRQRTQRRITRPARQARTSPPRTPLLDSHRVSGLRRPASAREISRQPTAARRRSAPSANVRGGTTALPPPLDLQEPQAYRCQRSTSAGVHARHQQRRSSYVLRPGRLLAHYTTGEHSLLPKTLRP
jgi:hypothetical protein